MTNYIGSHIGDLHVGAVPPEDLIYELKKSYIEPLMRLPKLDYITVTGDTFNHKLSLDSKHSKCAFTIMDMLTDLAVTKGAKFRILEGTDSHDASQLENFTMYQKKLDFRIIRTVTEEYLFDDLRVLYIPEEYIKDPKKYYKYYFEEDSRYDLIFGHGQFKETSFMKQESELSKLDAPIFDVIEMNRICKGPIIFGHIHIMMTLYNSVFYNGSFTRWIQGEEGQKGSLISIYNTDNPDKFIIAALMNEIARRYMTKDISKMIKKYEVEDLYNAIMDYINIKNIYKLRLKILDTGESDVSAKIAMLRSMIGNKRNIDLMINSLTVIQQEEEEQKIVDKYSYLFENSSIESKISTFSKNEFGYEIDTDKISNILYNKNFINELMDE